MTDQLPALLDQVSLAASRREPVCIRGGNSKREQVGRLCEAQELDVRPHRGIVDYQPDELVISARAGTPLVELQSALAQHQQILPFEPPLYGGTATLGGTLACNLSGPGRPWLGSIRDAVLGLQLINGRAEILNVGGTVMKNVAGYDVSRLQAGALGTLGVITTVHMRVLPAPESTLTLSYDVTAAQALDLMSARAAQPKPLTAACWVDGQLFLRLAGAAGAVTHTAAQWGGEQHSESLWPQLRDMTHPFFSSAGKLWRLSTAPNTAHLGGDNQCIDWGGAQRWLRGDEAVTPPPGSHLSLFAGGDRRSEVRGSLPAVQQRLHQRLKQSFDPVGIFNPGRLYSWM